MLSDSLKDGDRVTGHFKAGEIKRDFRVPRISPDGKRVVLVDYYEDANSRDVWIYDIEGDSFSRLTFEEEQNGASIWSPDGKSIVFQTGSPGARGLAQQPADRSTPSATLIAVVSLDTGESRKYCGSLSPSISRIPMAQPGLRFSLKAMSLPSGDHELGI